MIEPLQNAFFNCIMRRLESRKDDLFTLTGCTGSFEEWCNWETYIACKNVSEWCTIAKPKYGGKDGFDVVHPEHKNCFGDIDTAWISYLKGIRVWNSPALLSSQIQLQPHGCLVAKAFHINW